MVSKARASSAAGSSGVHYKLHNNCPRLLYRLWTFLKVIRRRGKVVYQLKYVEGARISKM